MSCVCTSTCLPALQIKALPSRCNLLGRHQFCVYNRPLASGRLATCRHFGGINYPKGGVGRIAEELADGGSTLGMAHITVNPQGWNRDAGLMLA